MSLNTLETAYVNGQIIDASHVNELTLALLGQFVGRDANGIPTPSQSLGTLAIPWGNLYAEGIILNGLALDPNTLTTLANRIVSGKSRSLSSQADFLRANGGALEFDILGDATDLVLSINNTATSISTDLNVAGIVAAPSTNNTADVNDADMANDLYAGEIDAEIKQITIDNAGTEFTSRVGEIIAIQTPTGEIFQGLLESTTKITNVFRGYYLNDSGNAINRGNLSNNDVLTLMNIGWVFVEDNGTTIDVSYTTPVVSYSSPTSPSTGDYWFDISNQVWKRYSGVTFEVIDRILVGQVVSDDTNTIASRSLDFSNQYRELNNIELDIFSTEILNSSQESSRCSVYGTEVQIDLTKVNWNITTDLESGLVEASDTTYYVYISDQGQKILSDKKPFERKDLKGFYHPHHSWRCVGTCYNDSSNDLVLVDEVLYNPNIKQKTLFFKDVKASGVSGGSSSTSFSTRNLNTTEGTNLFALLDSNQIKAMRGKYKIISIAHSYRNGNSVTKLVNIDDSVDEIIGTPTDSPNTTNVSSQISHVVGEIQLSTTKALELQTSSQDAYSDGHGKPANRGVDEIYVVLEIIKVG